MPVPRALLRALYVLTNLNLMKTPQGGPWSFFFFPQRQGLALMPRLEGSSVIIAIFLFNFTKAETEVLGDEETCRRVSTRAQKRAQDVWLQSSAVRRDTTLPLRTGSVVMAPVWHPAWTEPGRYSGGGNFFFKDQIWRMIRNWKRGALRGFQELGTEYTSNALESRAFRHLLRFSWRE